MPVNYTYLRHHPSSLGQVLNLCLLRSLYIAMTLLVIPFHTCAAQTIRVGVFNNKPIVFQDEEGKAQGMAVDVLEKIAAQEEWQLQYRLDSWGNLIHALENNEIDLLMGIAYTAERAQKYDFTQETLINNWAVVMQAASDNISSLEGLAEKRIALMKRSIHSAVFVETMRSFDFKFHIVEVADYQATLDAVKQGKADAAIVNRVYSMLQGKSDELKETGIIFNPVEVRYAAPKNTHPDILNKLDQHLSAAKLNAASYYYDALGKWLGSNAIKQSYQWVLWLVIITVSLLALVVSYNYILANQVRQKTAALTRSEQRYKMAQSAAKIGSWEWDIRTNKLYWSDNIAPMFGLKSTDFAGTYDAYLMLLDPETRLLVSNTIEDTLNKKQSYVIEHKVIWPNGEEHWVSAKGEVHYTSAGDVSGVLGVVQDITEQRMTMASLKINEYIVSASRDFMAYINSNYRYKAVNDAYLQATGLKREEILGKHISIFTKDNEYRDWIKSNLDKCFAGEEINFKAWFEFQNTGRRYLETTYSPFRDQTGAVVGVVIDGHDLTDMYLVDTTICNLAKGSRDFHDFIQSVVLDLAALYQVKYALIGILTPDEKSISTLAVCVDGNIVDNFVYELAGTPCADVLDLNVEFIPCNAAILYPDDHLLVEMGIDSYFGSPIQSSDGKMLGLVSVSDTNPMAISEVIYSVLSVYATRLSIEIEKFNALSELKEHQNHLEELVKERTRKYEVINRELEAFSYSVSHDLRAPLRAIDGFSEALREDYEDVLDDTGKEYLNRVRKAAQHMSTLIDDLLHLSRVSRSELDKHEVDLSKMVTELLQQRLDEQSDRKVRFHVEPALKVNADKRLLEVVINNLADNAVKYTRGKEETVIEFGCERTEAGEAFYLKDNGAGFDMRYVEKLFSPFQRLHAPSEFEGTGIGLATVKRIITRHGGRVWVHAVEGKGATFYFTL